MTLQNQPLAVPANTCLYADAYPMYPPVPMYPLAPYCVFSCCNDTGESNENNVIVVDLSQEQAPGCMDWRWPSSTGVLKCKENCANGEDDNWDSLVDCDDPDCSTYPDCSTIIDPPNRSMFLCSKRKIKCWEMALLWETQAIHPATFVLPSTPRHKSASTKSVCLVT